MAHGVSHSSFHSGSFHNGNFHNGNFHHGNFHNGGFNRNNFFFGVGLGWGYDPWWGYYGGYSPWFYGDYNYSGYNDALYYSDYAAPAYAATNYAYPGVTGGYPNVYSNPSLATVPDVSALPNDSAIYVRVLVPPEAEVWFEGQKTTQKGLVRYFESPPVAPGLKYAYHIRARWTRDGREVDETREFTVYAGTKLSVDFTQRDREKIPAPKAKPVGE
jgi:uncharacterized protein (TIGR03000 family)